MCARAACRLVPTSTWIPHWSITHATIASLHCQGTGCPRPLVRWCLTCTGIHSARAAMAPAASSPRIHGRSKRAEAARQSSTVSLSSSHRCPPAVPPTRPSPPPTHRKKSPAPVSSGCGSALPLAAWLYPGSLSSGLAPSPPVAPPSPSSREERAVAGALDTQAPRAILTQDLTSRALPRPRSTHGSTMTTDALDARLMSATSPGPTTLTFRLAGSQRRRRRRG